MRDEPSIRHITTRHENGAAHMANGYARASGKPGVAMVVPGACVYNAASGLATAYARSTPVFLIAGQISRGQMGKDLGAIHEVLNQAEVVAPGDQVAAASLAAQRGSRRGVRGVQADAHRRTSARLPGDAA